MEQRLVRLLFTDAPFEHLEYRPMRNCHRPRGCISLAFTNAKEGGSLMTVFGDDYVLDQKRAQLVEPSPCEQSEQQQVTYAPVYVPATSTLGAMEEGDKFILGKRTLGLR